MLVYRLLADLIVVVHFAYVAFVAVGMLLILVGIVRHWQWVRNFWFRIMHLVTIAIVVLEAVVGITCPLTDWEYDLRVVGGQEGQEGTFVGRMVHAAMFFEAPDAAFTVGYCLFGLAVLAAWIVAPPRRPRRAST